MNYLAHASYRGPYICTADVATRGGKEAARDTVSRREEGLQGTLVKCKRSMRHGAPTGGGPLVNTGRMQRWLLVVNLG
jgi:hypothetical protein